MAIYQWGSSERLALAEIDLDYRRYRLVHRQAEEAMIQSLRRYGQLSPVVICEAEGRLLVLPTDASFGLCLSTEVCPIDDILQTAEAASVLNTRRNRGRRLRPTQRASPIQMISLAVR